MIIDKKGRDLEAISDFYIRPRAMFYCNGTSLLRAIRSLINGSIPCLEIIALGWIWWDTRRSSLRNNIVSFVRVYLGRRASLYSLNCYKWKMERNNQMNRTQSSFAMVPYRVNRNLDQYYVSKDNENKCVSLQSNSIWSNLVSLPRVTRKYLSPISSELWNLAWTE